MSRKRGRTDTDRVMSGSKGGYRKSVSWLLTFPSSHAASHFLRKIIASPLEKGMDSPAKVPFRSIPGNSSLPPDGFSDESDGFDESDESDESDGPAATAPLT